MCSDKDFWSNVLLNGDNIFNTIKFKIWLGMEDLIFTIDKSIILTKV